MNAKAIAVDTLETPLQRNLSKLVALSEQDAQFLNDLYSRRKTYPKRYELVLEGDTEQRGFVLWNGWACTYKMLLDGARQIVDVRIPGDFIGLRGLLLQASDHSCIAETPVEISEFSWDELLATFRRAPRFATSVLWVAARDEAILVEHLVDIGRRDTLSRTAHFMLELGERLQSVRLGSHVGFECPLPQSLFADALGMSAIHMNRCLRILRERGLMTFQNNQVTFDDRPGLAELAGFDASYMNRRPPTSRSAIAREV
ncbi:Crp/Fnr family transcriptional regulator [Acuticoccus sediminis]|uniref:Crp/Fnr family transcriptional regulator n=1 Tax=Acuticoccus sediminis TaxID=2184697 RepID=A0A8B2NSH3_9HYPH|nr:Crp/Fnr family transcriptional regulator [Acuticoccus sediminis]RAH98332.1 Crp/Fnr family transcriptional regulator [Acuticoccus sediminis]